MQALGFVSAILAHHSFGQVVDFASLHGFRCVEMMCWPQGKAERRYAGVTHIDVDSLDERQVQHIQQYLAQKAVFISGLGYYPNPLDPDPEQAAFFRAHLCKVIRAAARLGVPVVNTFIGRNPHTGLEENFAQFLAHWPPIVQLAGELGVKIAIENCPMLFTWDEWPGGKNMATSPAIWARMFEAIPDAHFGLNYDPSHFIWQQMDEVAPLYTFRDRIFHVHLKDARLYRDKLNALGILAPPLQYHSPKIPGLGDVRWGDFFAALSDIAYTGPVCVEVEDKAFEGTQEGLYEALLRSRNYLSRYLVLE